MYIFIFIQYGSEMYKLKVLIEIVVRYKKDKLYNVQKMLDQPHSITNYLYLYALQSYSAPTKEEIQQTIDILKTKFPKQDPFNIMQALYRRLIQLKKKQVNYQQNSNQLSINQSQCYDYHNFLKKMIAKSFYYLGYGYQKFIHFMIKQHASFHIDKNMYNIFCEGMVLQLYRSLQKMMIKNGEKIKIKHKDSVRELNQWILNDRIYLRENDSELLRSFISKRYDIRDTYFTIVQAKKLYEILEKRYDPFVSIEIQQMEDCLNNIQLNSDGGESPLLNLEQLINYNKIQEQQLKSKKNPIRKQQKTTALHYQNLDSDFLNFDIDSNQYE